jgi:hypothetical protein
VCRLAQPVKPPGGDEHALSNERDVGAGGAHVDRPQRRSDAALRAERREQHLAVQFERRERGRVGVGAGHQQGHTGVGVGKQRAQGRAKRDGRAGGRDEHHRGTATIADRVARSQRPDAHVAEA